MAMLVEGGRKVGSGLLQFGNLALQDGLLLSQLAGDAVSLFATSVLPLWAAAGSVDTNLS